MANDMTRTAWFIRLSLVAAVASVSHSTTRAEESLTMRVSPRQALAPVNLQVTVRVEPDAENRILRIVTDSPEFYRSSEIPLEGDRAPRQFSVEYPSVPGGEYEVTGVLVNAVGRERAIVRQSARVVPAGGGEPW